MAFLVETEFLLPQFRFANKNELQHVWVFARKPRHCISIICHCKFPKGNGCKMNMLEAITVGGTGDHLVVISPTHPPNHLWLAVSDSPALKVALKMVNCLFLIGY